MLTFATRSSEKEFMDAGEFQGADLAESLAFIRVVNLLGGGQRAVTAGLRHLLSSRAGGTPIRILDVGCGLGDMGPAVIRWGQAQGYAIRYLGIDQSPATVAAAKTWIKSRYPDLADRIEFAQGNLFSAALPEADIITASMVFHHLDNDEIIKALRHLHRRARLGVVINDLERSVPAYLACFLLTRLLRSPQSRFDALLSVRKGFTREELAGYLAHIAPPDHPGSFLVRRALGWRLVGILSV